MAAESAATSAEENVAANAKTSSAPSVIADAAMDLCAHCTAAPGLLVCLGCHQAGYCSSACQRDAWCVCITAHKPALAKLPLMRNAEKWFSH